VRSERRRSNGAGPRAWYLLGAIAAFERERIRERVMAGLQRTRGQGKRLGRSKSRLPVERLESVEGVTLSDGAERLQVSVHAEAVEEADSIGVKRKGD
jgi:DNA invertase Pin-like site-specific DNA recombinase